MIDLPLHSLLQLRLLVGFLGERSQFAWWSTMFYEASSQAFLRPVFSKTCYLSQYHGVLEAARRFHDENLNVRGYHLFRLPEEFERSLWIIAHQYNDDNISVVQSKGDALKLLWEISEGRVFSVEGPINIGNIMDFDGKIVVPSMAAIYLSAFNGGIKAYPYFMR